MTNPTTSPAVEAGTRRDFSGTTPVILTDGRLLGYVFPAPMPPTARISHGDRDHWTYATPNGYVSPFNVVSRGAAVLALAAQRGIGPEDRAELDWHDLDLMAVLHGLNERYTPQKIASAAVTYATARADPDGELTGVQTGAVDRQTITHVIASTIGAATARDTLAAYDAVHGIH